jgi:hypothetical protein
MIRSIFISITLATGASVASAGGFTGPSGQQMYRAKCSYSPDGCYNEAANTCRGKYQIVDSESHAGGLFADIMPGPVTYYSITYACGQSNGRMADFPFRGGTWSPPSPPQNRRTNCTSTRNGDTIYTSCY